MAELEQNLVCEQNGHAVLSVLPAGGPYYSCLVAQFIPATSYFNVDKSFSTATRRAARLVEVTLGHATPAAAGAAPSARVLAGTAVPLDEGEDDVEDADDGHEVQHPPAVQQSPHRGGNLQGSESSSSFDMKVFGTLL